MKKYDHEKRKWVSEEEYERTHKPKDKSVCRGKKPHDFVLVLPAFVSYTDDYKFNPEIYYQIEEETEQFLHQQNEKLRSHGIIPRWSRRSVIKHMKLYMCSVCKKQKYE